MPSEGNGMVWHVAFAGAVAQDLKVLYKQAKDAGSGAAYIDAVRFAILRMRDNPLDFGELIKRRPKSGLIIHVRIVKPLRFEFAIHEETHKRAHPTRLTHAITVPIMPHSSLSRRKFIATSATIAATSALALPASAQPVGANERINIGLIGTGGRCRHLMGSLAKVPNTRMMALCDVYEPNLELAQKLAEPKAFTTRDYHALLARKDVHAVLIASPDHWHTPMTIDAMAAGKDVYVEKPLTHKMREGAEITAALAKHRKIVQVGTQQRSMPHIIRAKELITAGRIGTVHKVHMTWNRNSDRVRRGPQNVEVKRLDWKRFLGNAPMQDFDDYKFRNWRWFWDFGNGILTDLMVHWLDVAHWILNVDHPDKAVTLGQFNTARDVWQTPDTIQTLLHYGNNLQMHFEGTFCNARNGAMIEFMGSEGTVYIDRGRFELIPEPRFPKNKPEEQILDPKLPRGRDFYPVPDGELLHLQNWIDAIRNNRQPSAPISAGVSAAAAAHLGNEAYRQNRVAVWPK